MNKSDNNEEFNSLEIKKDRIISSGYPSGNIILYEKCFDFDGRIENNFTYPKLNLIIENNNDKPVHIDLVVEFYFKNYSIGKSAPIQIMLNPYFSRELTVVSDTGVIINNIHDTNFFNYVIVKFQ